MKTFFAGLLLLVAACPALAHEPTEAELENWHQWRGPMANGTAPKADPPLKWSETENVKWKVEIPGKGSGTPIVWNDSVFVMTAVDTGKQDPNAKPAEPEESNQGRRGGRDREKPTTLHQFIVYCLDRSTGDVKWKHMAAEQVPNEAGHSTNTFASASAVTNGEKVWASFGSVGIVCLDAASGALEWKRDLGDMQTRNAFGEASSPALYGDTLVVPWDHEADSKLFALDANTGATRWTTGRDEVTTWNTPLITEFNGQPQVILNGTNRSRGYDLKTGKQFWECGGQATNPIACPVRFADNVICMTGYRGYAVYSIPLDSTGDITDSDKITWSRTDAGPYIASPVLVGDRLYYTKSRDAILTSVNAATGETVIEPERIPGLGTLYASLSYAAGKIYVTDRDGKTAVLEEGDQFKVLATNELDDGVDGSLAFVGKQVFIRGPGHVYCIE